MTPWSSDPPHQPLPDRPPTRGTVSRFTTNSAVLFASQVLNTVLASAFAVVFIRHFGREEYGVYSTVYAYISMFLMLGSLGVDFIVTREVARNRNAVATLGQVAGLRVTLSIACMAACWAALPLLHPTTRFVWLTVLATLSLPLSFYPFYFVVHTVDLDMGVPKLVLGVWSIVYTAARFGMIAIGLSLESFVLAGIASDLVTFGLARRIGARSGVRFKIRFDWSTARRLLSESWPIALAMVFLQVLLRVDQIMLYRMRGAAEVGLYAVPVRVVEFASVIPSVIAGSAFPLLARLSGDHDGTRLDLATRETLRTMAWIALPIATYLFFYAEPLLGLLFGADFAASSGILRMLAYSLVFSFSNAMLFNRFLATGRQRVACALAATAACLNAALNVPLIHSYGGQGAALATLISYCAVSLLAASAASVRDLGRTALRVLLRPSLAAAVSLALLEWLAVGPLLGAVVLGSAYLICLVVTGEIGRVEARLLARGCGWTTTERASHP
jgi:O-antigen/teichoic acid export membrane protein